MKRYFNEKLCHGDKKPTGKAGDMKDTAQGIRRKILKELSMQSIGADSDAEDEQDEDFVAEAGTVDDFDVGASMKKTESPSSLPRKLARRILSPRTANLWGLLLVAPLPVR